MTPDRFQRVLKRNQTHAEKELGRYFRHKPFGLTFEPQRRIGRWYADFYCEAIRLVIEIDGPPHSDPKRRKKDLVREQSMAKLGIVTMRFSNVEILSKIMWIDAEIGRFVELKRGHTPSFEQDSQFFPQPRNEPNPESNERITGKHPHFHTSDAVKSLSLPNKNRKILEASDVMKKVAQIAKRKGLPCTITPEEL